MSPTVEKLLREAYEHQKIFQHKITGHSKPVGSGWTYEVELLCSECDFRGVFKFQSYLDLRGTLKLETLLWLDPKLELLVKEKESRVFDRFDRILRAHPRGF